VNEIVLSGVRGVQPVGFSAHDPKLKWCAAAQPSRGEQMNLGAQQASGDTLLFQHVDSELTFAHLDSLVAALRDPAVIGGGFHRSFDERHPSLRWLESLERLHLRAFGTIYGDQSVFVRRAAFAQLGGFAAVPLMEDVEFSKRLRRSGTIVLLDPPMRSSPRRQIAHGAWRVTFRNLFFLIAYRCGVSPHQLHAWYYADLGRTVQPAPQSERIPSSEELQPAE
jgi:hypothetical protein